MVLTLMGLLTAMIAPNIFSTSMRAEQEKLVAELIDLDTRARVLSGRHDGCSIKINTDRTKIQLVVVDEIPTLIKMVQIPHYASLKHTQEFNIIDFDRIGRSINYGYTLDFNERQVRIKFNGLTGWHEIGEGTNE